MSEHKSVILNGQILHGNDRLGHWRTTQTEGWTDSPPVKNQDTARPQDDGDHDLPVRYAARPVTLGGRVICSSEAAAIATMNRITGLVQGKVRLEIMDQGEATWADVKLTDKVLAKRTGRLVRFQYQLRAPDPRRYGDPNPFTVATGAPITASHRGNYPATPRFTVTGSMPGGYTITVDGWDYEVDLALTSGTPHVIDYRDGYLRINGAIRQDSLGNTNLRKVPGGPGVGVGLYPTTTGSGTAAMVLLDTYI